LGFLPVSLAPGFFEGKGNKNGFQMAEGLSQYSRPDTDTALRN